MALVAPVWMLGRRRPRAFAALVIGALVPVLGFGLVDLATWGTPWGSFIAYVRFNFIEGRAAEFGTEPWRFYIERLFHRAPVVLERTGNTSSASIPLALADALDRGRVADGDLVLFVGFGAGMTAASAVVRWTTDATEHRP
jgi:hypothetical protein